MKVDVPLALCLTTAALLSAGWLYIDHKKAETHTISLYGASGAPIGKWIGKGGVKITTSGCSFTAEDGREITIGGTYLIESQR